MAHDLLKGKKGIIFGALDEKSIAWKTALKCFDEGAQLVLTNAPVALRMGEINKLAAACGIDPVEIRLLNAMVTGDKLITGQIIENVAPVARCIRETAALPLPDEPVGGHDHDPMRLPGGAGRTADSSHIVRGIDAILRNELGHKAMQLVFLVQIEIGSRAEANAPDRGQILG